MDKKRAIVRRLEENIRLMKWLQDQADSLFQISRVIAQALSQGNKAFFLGNGGSAADAQHLAGELAGRFYRNRAPLAALALTDNISAITAIANDLGYEHTFSRQIKALAQPGDIVVAISTSGNSPNVLEAVEEARRRGAVTVAFTGQGGHLRTKVDYVLSIPSHDVPLIQEAYMVAGHLICFLVEDEVCGSQ